MSSRQSVSLTEHDESYILERLILYKCNHGNAKITYDKSKMIDRKWKYNIGREK